jgi:hypothetical protein
VDLFKFNDDFIASVAIGHSDEDTLELFAESIRAGADVLERRLRTIAAPRLAAQARFYNGAFEIPLDQDQFDSEFGGAGEPPQANVRRAIIQSTIQGGREMTKVLGAD